MNKKVPGLQQKKISAKVSDFSQHTNVTIITFIILVRSHLYVTSSLFIKKFTLLTHSFSHAFLSKASEQLSQFCTPFYGFMTTF